MFSQKECTLAVRHIVSQNQWHEQPQLASATVQIHGISDEGRDELLVNPIPPGIQNQYGTLLLPHELCEEHRGIIMRGRWNPAIVIYDSCGRVHQLVLDGKCFLILMDQWKVTKILKSMHTDILHIDFTTSTLQTTGRELNRFRLPRDCLNELRGWQPQGTFQIEYDGGNRVFRISQPEQGLLLEVGLAWDSRFLINEMTLVKTYIPKARTIVRRDVEPLPQKEEFVETIEIENDNALPVYPLTFGNFL